MAFLDTEPNNSPFQPSQLGTVNGNLLVNGILGNGVGRDTFDFYRFRVTEPSRFGATLVPTGGNANIVLTDRNNNLIDISTRSGTSLDTIESDVLLPGEYTIQINKASTDEPDISYALSMAVGPAQPPKVNVTIARVDAVDGLSDPFSSPDLYATVRIDGTEKRTQTVRNEAFVNFNQVFTQEVDLGQRSVPITLRMFDEDRGPDDEFDINPTRNIKHLPFQLDTQTGILSGSGLGNASTGRDITVTGSNTLLGLQGRIRFRVDVGNSLSSFSSNTPITRGTRSSNFLQGGARGGILDGGKGRDEILGMGGDDALLGGKGRDDLDGGRGKDIMAGGKGRDIYTGGRGRDVFVIGPDFGVEVITDFQNGKDKLGLPFGMSPELLDIQQRGSKTILGVGGDRIAVLKGVDADTINARDFVSVDFAQFSGMEVPTLV